MSLVFFLMIRRPPRSTRTDTSFPTRRSSDLLNVVPEIKTAPEQVEALKRTRTGIIMGIDLMKKYGWKIGDRVSLHSTIWVRKDDGSSNRSEEHTSELQSLMRISYAVFCLQTTTQKKNVPSSTQL